MDYKVLAILGLIFTVSCAQQITIDSEPRDAKVYLKGDLAGRTPVKIRMKNPSRSNYAAFPVTLKKEGYKTTEVGIEPLLYDYLISKYPRYNKFTLEKEEIISDEQIIKLKKLKTLLDNGALTKDEYEIERKRVLEMEN